MITIKSLTNKTILLITLTTLTITLATSLNSEDWNSPENNEKFTKSNFDLDLKVNNSDNADSINFTFLTAEDYDRKNNTGVSSDTFVEGKFGIGGNIEGKHKVAANSSDGTDIVQSFWIDRNPPSIDFVNEFEFLGSDPTVEVEIKDAYLDIDSVDASASGDASVDSVGSCSGTSCDIEVDLDTGGLVEGDEFDINVSANDTAGNFDYNEKSNVVFDSKWDGDDSADVEWGESEEKTLNAEDEDDKDVDVIFEPDSVSKTTLTCSWDGGEDTVSDIDTSDESVTESCEIDYEDVGGSRFDLTVSAKDNAGNPEKDLVVDEELVWDSSDPVISGLSQSEGLITFNSGFSMSVEGSDDASGIERLEYYFDEDTSVGDGSSIDFGDSGSLSFDESFDVDTSDLGQGNHTVFVRVEDKVGNTDVESFDFEYFPDRSPDIVLNGSSEFRVTSGSSDSYSFSIRNDSPFFVEKVEVSGGGLWNGTVSALNLESGDSKEKMAEIDASELSPDTYSFTLKLSNYDVSKDIDVIVEANSNQASNINSSVEDWMEKAERLDKNASDLPTIESGNGSLTAFEDRVQEAQSDIQSGNYYLAKQKLEDMSSRYQEASNTVETAVEQHEKNKRNQLIMIGVSLFILILVVALVVYKEYYEESEGLELDLEDLKSSFSDLKKGGWLENLKEKIEELKEKDGSEGDEKGVSFKDQNKGSESNGSEEDEEDEDDFEYHYKES